MGNVLGYMLGLYRVQIKMEATKIGYICMYLYIN